MVFSIVIAMKKWAKRIAYFFGGIIVLLLLLILLLQTTWAKNLLRDKLQTYISQKTKNEFVIGSIDYSLPKWVELNGVFMMDKVKDTLLYGRQVKVDLAMFKLIRGKFEVNKIVLDNVYINLSKKELDSVFNYQFIADAFKSKPTDAKGKDTSSTFDFSIKDIELRHLRFNRMDYNQGSLLKIVAGQFHLNVDSLDLYKMHFGINKLYADSIYYSLQILKEQPPTNIGVPATIPLIKADSLIIKNSTILFEDRTQQVYTNNHIGLLQAAKLNNTKNANTFTGKSFLLSNSSIDFRHATKEQTVTVSDHTLTATASNGTSLRFEMDELSLLQNSIVYNNIAKPIKKVGFDYYHLGIKDLNLVAKATKYGDGKIQSNIQRFSFNDKSGFRIDSLSGEVNVDSTFVALKNFVLFTPTSHIKADAMVYTAFGTQGKGEGKLPDNDITLTKTIIGRKDLELLADGLTEQYRKQLDELGNLLVDAHITGNAEKFYIHQLTVNATRPNTLNLQMSGDLDISNKKNISYNTNIKNLTASQKIISPFLKNIKQKIYLPPIINMKGSLIGDARNVNANITTSSNFGVAAIKAKLKGFDRPEKMVYDIAVNGRNLETGKWIGQDSLYGKLNGQVAVKGNSGFDVRNNDMKVIAAIKSFGYRQNTIDNININTILKNGLINGTASIKDELIAMNFNGKANIHNEYPTVDALVNVANADLLALGFSKDTLNITALTKIKIDDATPKNLKAIIRIDSAVIKRSGQKISLDSATVLAFVRNDSTIMQVVSPFADADIRSTVYYTDMPMLLQETMNKFLPQTVNPSSIQQNKNKPSPAGTIQANILIKPNETYQALVKNISFDEAITVNAIITNKNQDSTVNVKMNVPGLQIDKLRLNKMQATMVGKGDSLNMNISIDTLKSGDVLLYDAAVKAGFSKNNLSASIVTKDEDKKQQYKLSAAAKPNNIEGYDITLGKDLMLNHQTWAVNSSNIIQTSKEGFNIQNFDISKNNQKVAVHNETVAASSPIIIDIKNFKLSSISALLNKDSLLVEGLLNADVKVSDIKNAIPTMDGKIKLDSIMYQNMSVGNLDLNAQSSNSNVTVSGKLLGNGNNVDISGNYNAQNIDVKINLNPISMSSIQPFTKGNLVRSTGTVTGPINITGSASSPNWNGELNFNKVQSTLGKFGTVLKIENQKIVLNYPTIKLDNFTILDSTNNALKINGTITQTQEKYFNSDLTVKANNFHVLNNTPVDNNMLYGNGIVDVDAYVSGNIAAPEITGNVAVKNGTAIKYVRQNTPSSSKERDGIMEFINMDTVTNLLTEKTYQEVLALQEKESSYGSLNYNLNIDIEPEAKFNVIVDPITGDELEVQGQAQLNAAVNPNGSIGLVGTYNLKKGSYQLNYQFIKRKFILMDGSTITLSGDPSRANADITASYEIKTSPFDLIGGEITSTSGAENAIYKRKAPFQVLLKIKGIITEPELSFDIALKEKSEGITYEMTTTIENKLKQLRSDQSAMNKQVFALLVLNRFIGEQSRDFFAGNGTNNTNLIANQSVSGFLNGAINQIAADLIKGIDIDINLKNVDDDPNAQRTDLSVALSKSFLDDRLNISVGKSFTLDGNDPGANGKNTSNNNVQFIPDVNTTYKLSKDGKYMIRAYRRNQYEALLDGYFIETGVAFTFTVNYDKLKELFNKKKK